MHPSKEDMIRAMPRAFCDADHRKLDTLIDGILNAYKNSEMTIAQARAALAHLMCANEHEVKRWLEPEVLVRYMKMCGI